MTLALQIGNAPTCREAVEIALANGWVVWSTDDAPGELTVHFAPKGSLYPAATRHIAVSASGDGYRSIRAIAGLED